MHHAKWTLKHKNMEFIHANTVYYTYSSDAEYTVFMLVEDLQEAGATIEKILYETEQDAGSMNEDSSLSADSFLQQYHQMRKNHGTGMDYTIFCELNDIPFAVNISDSQIRETDQRIVISSDSFCFDVNRLLSAMEKLNDSE